LKPAASLRAKRSNPEARGVGVNRALGAALIALGAALMGWSAYSTLRPIAHYDAKLSPAPPDATKDTEGFRIKSELLQQIAVKTPDERRPVATGLVAHDRNQRLVPLVWRNGVTESIFFADVSAADLVKVLTAIREHAPEDAVVLAWWDLSRAIRLIAERDAPLDDSEARGLQLPAAWTEARDIERARWGAGASAQSAQAFGDFIDAMLSDEARGAETLRKLAGGKPAYVVAHISDVWKAAATRPERLSIAYKDFPSSGVSHGLIKSAQQWMRENRIDGAFAVEPMLGATRLHYFQRKDDAETLIAKLLPFSTSNPMRLERFELVYQHKGWWIYRLK
jgi:hydroxylamine oxidation protein HaoB